MEFPCGLRDNKSPIKKIALNEFEEETGLKVISNLNLVCRLIVDTGRVENNFYGFITKSKFTNKKPEEGIKRILVSKEKLIELIKKDKFNHSLHVSHFTIAMLKKLI